MTDDLAFLDATAQAEYVAHGKLSARELVDAAIARIERIDPQLNAVIHRRFERARMVVESSLQLSRWEQHPPNDMSVYGALVGRTLGALAQPI